MRTLILAGLLAVSVSGAAWADQSVAGKWRADMGQGVAIDMDVSPNGHWSSETSQNNAVVRQMEGTYTQTHHGDKTGVLVFKPTESKVEKGKVAVETDHYKLTGDQLRLTSGGDTMVFNRQAEH